MSRKILDPRAPEMEWDLLSCQDGIPGDSKAWMWPRITLESPGYNIWLAIMAVNGTKGMWCVENCTHALAQVPKTKEERPDYWMDPGMARKGFWAQKRPSQSLRA